MIITDITQNILKCKINLEYWNALHKRTGSKVTMRIEVQKSDSLSGNYTVFFSVPFTDSETNELFIDFESESKMNFVLENEEVDYRDFIIIMKKYINQA